MNLTPEMAASILAKVGARSGNVALSDDEVDAKLIEGIDGGHVTSKSGAYLWFREVKVKCSRPRVLEAWDRVMAAAEALIPADEVDDDEDGDEAGDDEVA